MVFKTEKRIVASRILTENEFKWWNWTLKICTYIFIKKNVYQQRAWSLVGSSLNEERFFKILTCNKFSEIGKKNLFLFLADIFTTLAFDLILKRIFNSVGFASEVSSSVNWVHFLSVFLNGLIRCYQSYLLSGRLLASWCAFILRLLIHKPILLIISWRSNVLHLCLVLCSIGSNLKRKGYTHYISIGCTIFYSPLVASAFNRDEWR